MGKRHQTEMLDTGMSHPYRPGPMQDINVASDTRVRPSWTLGDRIRKARDAADMTQVELAEVLGVHPKTVARWESMHSQIGLEVLYRIAEVTNVDARWLVLGEG